MLNPYNNLLDSINYVYPARQIGKSTLQAEYIKAIINRDNLMKVKCKTVSGLNWKNPLPVSTFDVYKPVSFNQMLTKQEQEEKKMAYDKQNISVDLNVAAQAGRNLEAETRDFLLNKVNNARDVWGYWNENYRKLRKSYGLDMEEDPKSPEDFLDRVKNGKYTMWTQEKFEKRLQDWEDDEDCKPYFNEWFSWRDPAIKEDLAGFDAAQKQINKDLDNVRTTIMVLGNVEGKKALDEFLAKDYTVH